MPAPAWLTSEIVETWDRHAERMRRLYAGETLKEPFFIAGRMAGRSHGLWGTNDPDMLAEPEAWLEDVLADMEAHAADAEDTRTFRPFVFEIDPFGTHYIDALFGAPVRYHEGQAWSEELPIDLADLRLPDIETNAVFAASMRLARLAVERVPAPIWIANPVLSCPINIGVNLFGGCLLEAMVERPEAAGHALCVITDVIAACMRAFAAVLPPDRRLNSVGCDRWAPPGHGFIDGCATQLVSARHYRALLAPLDAELLGQYPLPGMVHLCGAHAQHIPVWREMAELKSVQLNDRAAEDFELYWRGLRDDQLVYVMPTARMTVDDILAISSGKRVVVQGLALLEPLSGAISGS